MSITGGVLLENESISPLDQLRQRWENLNKDQNTKLRLSLNCLEHDQLSPVSTAPIYLFIFHFVSNICVLLEYFELIQTYLLRLIDSLHEKWTN